MHSGKLVFSQLMEFLPWRRFETCVRRYSGDHKIKTFPCSEQLRVMAFAQLVLPQSELEFSFAGVSITPSEGGFHGSSPERIELTGA
jgi:hypothetical protein